MPDKVVKVSFKGQEYFWLKNLDNSGPISLNHTLTASFAYVLKDGTIRRYGKKLGIVQDLKEVRE